MADPVSQRPQFFNFDAQAVRVVGTPTVPWFVAKDVCTVLDIEWKGSGSMGPLDDDEKGVATIYTLGGSQEMLTVNESGLYALIFRSRKPQARLFRRWVTGTVLPAIRQTGAYIPPAPLPMSPAERAENLRQYAYLTMRATPTAGPGQLAIIPTATGRTVPDLLTEHVQRLLDLTIGEEAPSWKGTLSDLVKVCRAEYLFWWVIRDPLDTSQRKNLGKILARRVGISYLGAMGSHLQLRTIGRNRHRRYAIIRLEGMEAERQEQLAKTGGAS